MLMSRTRARRILIALTAVVAVSCSDIATEPTPAAVDAPTAAQRALAGLVAEARSGCVYGTLPGGSLFEVCFPLFWNGSSVVFYAHGYEEAGQPLAVPDDVVGGTPVVDIVRLLGYVYAATSYRSNGLAAADAATDLEELAALVQGANPALAAADAYLIGVSEGGLATALAMQNASTRFDGALAMCGPIGSFQAQANYMGDFRLVFDYFFPGVLPGGPFDPAALALLQTGWEGTYAPAIRAAISADLASGGSRTQQLFAVTRAAQDPSNPGQTAVDILWYNTFGTPDARLKLGGLPFGNAARVYAGSQNDALLNGTIPRFTRTANPTQLARYETTGRVERPTVTLHTTQDQIAPIWNEALYAVKVAAQGDLGQLVQRPTQRYGHCNFTTSEVLAAFSSLVNRVGAQQLVAPAELFASPAEETEFLRLSHAAGARPMIAREPARQR
jgi:hypothetical protein